MWNPFEQPELIPIPKGPCVSQSGRTHVNLPIPESTGITLGIYMDRLETWCAIAGISHLKIDVSSATNDDAPGVVGVDTQGQATAGLALYSSKQFADSSQRHSYANYLKMHRTISVEVKLRLQEIIKEISEKSEKGVRDAEALADKINLEIKKALLKEGLKFLLTNFSRPELLLMALRISNMAPFIAAHPHLTTMAIATDLFVFLTLGLTLNATRRAPFRPGLFVPSGPELDHALIFAICLLTQTLVEPIIEEANAKE